MQDRSAQPGATQDVAGTSRASQFARANRHSTRVRVLKIALPSIAVAIVAGFIGFSMISLPSGVKLDLGSTGFADGKLVMSNPKLEGMSNDRPYSLTATRALQDMSGSERIELEGIDGKLPIDDDNWATVAAEKGVFDRKANTLEIVSPITVQTTDGKNAHLQSAHVNVDTGEMTTSDPVDIRLEGLQILAGGMHFQKDGQVLVFSNKVRMNIEPGRVKTAEAESATPNVQN